MILPGRHQAWEAPGAHPGLMSGFYVPFMGVSSLVYLSSGLPLIYYQMNLVYLMSFRHLPREG